MRVVAFSLGAPTITLNEMRKMHFQTYKRHRQALSWEIKALTMSTRPSAPFARARVLVERFSLGEPDHDGLYGGLKPLIDCLVLPSKRHPSGLGIVLDDSPACMDLEARNFRVAKAPQQFTRVTITEMQ